MREFLFLMVFFGFMSSAFGAKLKAGDYEEREVRGWKVLVERRVMADARFEVGMKLLGDRLVVVEKVVPAGMLGKLKTVPIWVSRDVTTGACYHPNKVWLEKNGRMVEKWRGVELQNFDHFIDWSKGQPMMMLHELAHAYHHRELGFKNAVITAAFVAARDSGKYEKVKRSGGKLVRHYALTNEKEYFAECTEAYFGRNDFYPFERAELKEFDPKGYAMVELIWGVKGVVPAE